MGQLYKLDFPSGKSYIGITTRCARRRFNGHSDSARWGGDCLVHRAWRKYGPPKLTILAIVEDKILLETEVKAIAVYETLKPNGYNMTPGGASNPMDDPEFVEKVRVKSTGRLHTQAAKDKMSVWHKNNPPPIEITRMAIKANTGKKRPWMNGDLNPSKRADVKEKQSKASKGKPKSPEHRAKLIAHLYRVHATRRAKRVRDE